jgi:hypothetical protein
MHLRQGEVNVEKNVDGRSRAPVPGSYILRPERRRAEFGALFRQISTSVPFDGVPASLGPGLGNREWEETGIF